MSVPPSKACIELVVAVNGGCRSYWGRGGERRVEEASDEANSLEKLQIHLNQDTIDSVNTAQ